MTGAPLTASAGAAPIRAERLLVAAVLILALGALAYVMSQRQQALRVSAVGLEGLQRLLAADGVEAQVFSGGWTVDPATIGLQILPLHDTDPGRAAVPAATEVAVLFQPDEVDQDWMTIRAKLGRVDSLVVLPKWRAGMRLTGIAHPALLVDAGAVAGLLRELTGQAHGITRPPGTFADVPGPGGMQARLYAAQLFEAGACKALIGAGAATLLADCPLRGTARRVLILSDPDLIDNHGLRLGQNADIARDLLAPHAARGAIFIDYSLDNWLAPPEAPPRQGRSWADLLRLVQPPFRALWIGAGLLLALALARSLRRAGPVQDGRAAGLDKVQAIRARARLMRLTGQDGAMLGDYASARLAATAARLVGPAQARQLAEDGAFLRHLARRRPDLADRLADVLTRLRALPRRISPAEAIGHVDALEQILEMIAHDA